MLKVDCTTVGVDEFRFVFFFNLRHFLKFFSVSVCMLGFLE